MASNFLSALAALGLGAGAALAQPADGGGYLELDGVDDSVMTPGDFMCEALTVEAWVRPTSLHPLYTAGVVACGSRDVSSFDFGIGQATDTRLRFFINYNQGQQTIVGVQPIELEVWQHIAVTYDGETAKLYINGELDAEKVLGDPILPSGDGSMLVIGDDYPGASEFVGGSFDEVRVWTVVRTGAEIASDMFTPLTGDEPGLAIYYNFDECGSQVAVDRGPNGRHARLGMSYSVGDDDPVRMTYAPSRTRCLSVRSSDPGQLYAIGGTVEDQLAQINAGPPLSGWSDILYRHEDMHVRDAFECGDHLDLSYVDAETYLVGADEVTLDNCGSAFYRFEFMLPRLVEGGQVYGAANADDLAVGFVNGRPVTLLATADDVSNLGQDRVFEGYSMLGWPTTDPIREEQAADLLMPGMNSVAFGVCSDAGDSEPAGLEFELVIQYECAADWNADGEINTQDLLGFQNDWTAREPEADINQDGVYNSLDMLFWLNLWNEGCPE